MRTTRYALSLALVACSTASPPPPPAATPVSVAVLVEGTFGWMGDDLTNSDPVAGPTTANAYQSARIALDTAFAELPPGSEILIYTYGNEPTFRARGTTATVTSAALGEQRDYTAVIGKQLAEGVDIAVTELSRSKLDRKLLLVLGDGGDYKPHVASKRLAEASQRARQLHITAMAFVVPASFSEPPIIDAAMPTTRLEAARELVRALPAYVRAQLTLTKV